MIFRVFYRRMAVDDLLGHQSFMRQEFFPDPHKILMVLAVKRPLRVDARMAEEIVARLIACPRV